LALPGQVFKPRSADAPAVGDLYHREQVVFAIIPEITRTAILQPQLAERR
jgi:hypothetical protein